MPVTIGALNYAILTVNNEFSSLMSANLSADGFGLSFSIEVA